MEAVEMILGRKSIRKYKDEIVSEEIMREVLEIAKYAPSWANSQTARYNLITNKEVIEKIATTAVKGFVYNAKVLENAKNVAVISFVKGKSGALEGKGIDVQIDNPNGWEMFDSGIASQTFCLAAYEKGIGTCMFGIIDEGKIAELINLPKEETVAVLIVYGYPTEEGRGTTRKDVDEIVRFIK